MTQIDMKNRTVRLGSMDQLVDGLLPDGVGSNMYGYISQPSDWIMVAPEINDFEFTSSGSGDVNEAHLYWRPGYWGI